MDDSLSAKALSTELNKFEHVTGEFSKESSGGWSLQAIRKLFSTPVLILLAPYLLRPLSHCLMMPLSRISVRPPFAVSDI